MNTQDPLWTVADQIKPGRTALVVIDLQNDFTHPNGVLAKRRGVDVEPVRRSFPKVEALVLGARNADVPVIWLSVRHEVGAEPANYLVAQFKQPPDNGAINADDMLTHRGSWGAEWDAALPDPIESDIRLEKPGYNGFHGTRLAEILEQHDITTLVLCGCNTNVCIQATAAEGFFRGHYVVLAADACTSLDGLAAHEAALATHRRYYGYAITVADILDLW